MRRREANIQRCLDVRWVGSRRKTSAAMATLAMMSAQKTAVVHSGSTRNWRASPNGFVRTASPLHGAHAQRRCACEVYCGSETLRLVRQVNCPLARMGRALRAGYDRDKALLARERGHLEPRGGCLGADLLGRQTQLAVAAHRHPPAGLVPL